MAYNWRYFSSYRLNKDELERYLKGKFGDWNFYVEVGLTLLGDAGIAQAFWQLTGGERYKFWIERDLTPVRLTKSLSLSAPLTVAVLLNRLRRMRSWIYGGGAK
jgi:hypothetical protein